MPNVWFFCFNLYYDKVQNNANVFQRNFERCQEATDRVDSEWRFETSSALPHPARSVDGYHPFGESIKEIKSTGSGYPGSLLEQFYAIHQPANAAEAFIGFNRAPKSYRSFASYAYRLSPWMPGTPEAVIRVVQRFTERHGKRHAKQNLTFMAALGYQHIPAVLQRAYVVDVDMAGRQ